MRFTRAFPPSELSRGKVPGKEIFFKEKMKKLERTTKDA